jgi:DNA polymerase III subunit epsilon
MSWVALKAALGGKRLPDVQSEVRSHALSPSVPRKFVVFDLETTGFSAIWNEIIEVGAIRVDVDSDIHDTFQALVKPLKRIPKRITTINGISQEMVDRDGEPLQTVMEEFAAFIGSLPLVSFNAEFDIRFLRESAKRTNTVINNRVSCALTMARRAWPGRDSYRLTDIAKDGNLSDEGTHRALGDCKRTVIVYTAAASILGVT